MSHILVQGDLLAKLLDMVILGTCQLLFLEVTRYR